MPVHQGVHSHIGPNWNMPWDFDVYIGSYCSISQNVTAIGADHNMAFPSTRHFDDCGGIIGAAFEPYPIHNHGPLIIMNDVWVGYNAILMSGSLLGNGCVIGAGSTVAGKIPPYAVAVGNPARVIKYRFTPDQIASLERIRWWAWPEEKIVYNKHRFLSTDIDDFLEVHDAEYKRSNSVVQ